ncbi:hypothetical protein C8J57DRAFT_1704524 [Mycena rebaudengoi]|nr:hypothetical protein C8J57DRAFT_1704524 [Mycena rebaudengoi]
MVQVGSLSITPPLINASCAWASDLKQLQDLFDSPYTGAVTTRTSTLNGFPENESHTVAFSSSATTSINSYGYSPHKLASYLTWIESILENATSQKPFIISITASDADSMKSAIQAIQALRHKSPSFSNIGVEFNTSCPNIRGAAPTGYAFSSLAPLLSVLADEWRMDRTLTLGLKLPPYVYAAQFAEVLDTLHGLCVTDASGKARCPIAYFACTNTLGNSLLFAEQEGTHLHALALGNVYMFTKLLVVEKESESGLHDIAIIGIGGVTSKEAAARMRKAGAAIIGSATLFGKEGVRAFEILGQE